MTSAVSCLLCTSPTAHSFATTDRNRHLSDERFRYHRCDRCGTLSLAGIPADLDRYYPTEYYAIPSGREWLLANARHEQYKLDIIHRFVADGRLVEIGPAVGAFSMAAQEAGFDTSAIEMDAACCEFLRSVVGIRVEETDDPVAALAADGPFDVVAMWHVIEHLPNPGAVLSAAVAALRPGGIVALAAPNPAAFQFRLWRGRWTHVDAPRHLSLMPIQALADMAVELGAEPVLMTTRDRGTVAWNRFGWCETLAGFASGRGSRLLLRSLGSVLAVVAAPVERRGNNGTTYTLVLRKYAH